MSKKVNFGRVADDYAKYRDEIPSVIFEQLKKRNVHFSGKKVLDLGSGTGIFSRAMAVEGAEVTGVEPGKELIHQALEIDQLRGLNIEYINSAAENMELPLNNFDAVTALRSWHWFDRSVVNQRVMDFLKKDGYLIVIHSIFVPQLSKIAQETIKIIKEHISELKPAGSMGEVKERRSGFPINWFDEWNAAGFELVDEWEHEYNLEFTKNEWCGKVRSLSWLTNESEKMKQVITQKIQQYLIDYTEPLHIPHKYSVVLLKK